MVNGLRMLRSTLRMSVTALPNTAAVSSIKNSRRQAAKPFLVLLIAVLQEPTHRGSCRTIDKSKSDDSATAGFAVFAGSPCARAVAFRLGIVIFGLNKKKVFEDLSNTFFSIFRGCVYAESLGF
jgi:hypothetical protein